MTVKESNEEEIKNETADNEEIPSKGTQEEVPASTEEETPAEETPEFEPNYKYKVMDEEREVPEFLRSSITDEETQKSVLDILTKANGIDAIKASRDHNKEQLEDLTKNYETITGVVHKAQQAYERGDIEGFLKAVGAKEEKVLQWVVDRVKYNQSTPEEQQVFDRDRTNQQTNWDAESTNQKLQTRLEQQTQAASLRELEFTLDGANTKQFAESYDSREGGKRGDFRNVLLEEGNLEFYRSAGKTTLTMDAAAEKAIQKLSFGMPTPPKPGDPVKEITEHKPVIPNIVGKTVSPVKKGVTKVDDIKKIYEQKYGQPL